ncbi:UNVERIFIED_CONTAM: hypothetical protein FKN15_043244 [Acipenser sinensis]
MAEVVSVGVNLEAFSLAINAIQALRSSVTRVFDSLKDGMKNKETLEGREKAFITDFQDNLQSVNRDLNELERLSNLVGRPSESHPLHNSGLLSLDPVQDKTPLYSQLLQAYKWSNKLPRCYVNDAYDSGRAVAKQVRSHGGKMAEVVSVGVNLEAFSLAINAIQALRSSVTRVFDSLKDGMKNKETLEGREKAFITDFQDNLQSVNRDLNELERLSNLVGRPSESHPLHNSGLLSLDPVQDKTPLYSQLLQAYKWSNKLQYHAGLASSLLNQQSLKRSANQMGASAKRRPKVQPTTLVLPPQ